MNHPPTHFEASQQTSLALPKFKVLRWLATVSSICFAVAILGVTPRAAAQSTPGSTAGPFSERGAPEPRTKKPKESETKESTPNAAETELRERLEAAQVAQRSGDPVAAATANERLLALALREMGQLRLVETAFAQAIELYKGSLAFEDVPDAHVDLAIAELQANLPDEALAETDKATAADPGNARAFGVRGRVWAKKQEYAKAAEALARAVQLDPAEESDVETLYSLGICYLQSKDAQDQGKALTVFERMIRAQGDSGSLHVLFGRAYRDADDMPSAIREFERAIALDTRTPHAHYFLGLARLAVNEWKPTPEVRKEFAKELEYYPNDYLANYMTGFLASGDRNYAEADRYLKIAAGLDPRAPEPPLYQGLDAYAQGDNKVAEEMFRKAIELTGKDEGRSNYQIRRAYVDLGRILANSGRTDESEVYLGKARELQNKTMELTQQSVSAMALAGGAGSAAAIVPLSRQSEAEAAPLPAGSADPFAEVDAGIVARANLSAAQRAAADAQEKRLRAVLGLGFNDLATSEAVRKQYAAALDHYHEAEKWDASIEGLARNLGVCAFRVENYPEAIRGLSMALEQKGQDAPVRAMLGMAYFGTEHFADAVKIFSPLGMRGEQDSAVGYAWAASLARLGELKQASEVLRELEKTQLSSDTLLLVGQLWIEIGDYTRATNALHLALQSDASLRKAHYFAGQAYLRAEKWTEAAAEFSAELTLNPGDADARFNLGFVDLQQSKTDEAKALFEQVIEEAPRHANAQYELGKLLLDRGKVAEAITHLEIAAQLSPQTDYIHYQLQSAYRKDSRNEDAERELNIYKELKARQREKDSQRIPNQ